VLITSSMGVIRCYYTVNVSKTSIGVKRESEASSREGREGREEGIASVNQRIDRSIAVFYIAFSNTISYLPTFCSS